MLVGDDEDDMLTDDMDDEGESNNPTTAEVLGIPSPATSSILDRPLPLTSNFIEVEGEPATTAGGCKCTIM